MRGWWELQERQADDPRFYYCNDHFTNWFYARNEVARAAGRTKTAVSWVGKIASVLRDAWLLAAVIDARWFLRVDDPVGLGVVMGNHRHALGDRKTPEPDDEDVVLAAMSDARLAAKASARDAALHFVEDSLVTFPRSVQHLRRLTTKILPPLTAGDARDLRAQTLALRGTGSYWLAD
jgi:hypothetical protein